MKILLLGSKGQLGYEFEEYFINNNISYIAHDLDTLDISNFQAVEIQISTFKPNIIINCTAYNNVEQAEIDNKLACLINADSVDNLAKLALKYDFKLIHFSSDYIFDGVTKIPYTENDTPNPVNEYGKSKLLGEQFIQKYNIDFLIFRLSWVYGNGQQNFIYKLNQWSKNNSNLKITADEISIPTYTRSIVNVSMLAIQNELVGLYHCTNSGYVSRYEYALILNKLLKLNVSIVPISYSDLNLQIKRPLFSVLSNKLIQNKLGFEIPNWIDDLEHFIKTNYKP